ncbi:unnamed protein product [Pichia kudriavzevii]
MEDEKVRLVYRRAVQMYVHCRFREAMKELLPLVVGVQLTVEGEGGRRRYSGMAVQVLKLFMALLVRPKGWSSQREPEAEAGGGEEEREEQEQEQARIREYVKEGRLYQALRDVQLLTDVEVVLVCLRVELEYGCLYLREHVQEHLERYGFSEVFKFYYGELVYRDEGLAVCERKIEGDLRLGGKSMEMIEWIREYDQEAAYGGRGDAARDVGNHSNGHWSGYADDDIVYSDSDHEENIGVVKEAITEKQVQHQPKRRTRKKRVITATNPNTATTTTTSSTSTSTSFPILVNMMQLLHILSWKRGCKWKLRNLPHLRRLGIFLLISIFIAVLSRDRVRKLRAPSIWLLNLRWRN